MQGLEPDGTLSKEDFGSAAKLIDPYIENGLDFHTKQCVRFCVATNLQIDDSLLTEARKVGGFRTKKDTVNRALEEFIRRRKRKGIWDLEGVAEYYEDYDYKAQRKSR